MKKIIVTTTINPVTEAIRRFDAKEDWELIVIGDLKTPQNYHLERGRYVPPKEQEAIDKELSDAIGWNCLQRRNIGLLLAYQQGADIIATIDDDNIPNENWGKELFINRTIKVKYFTTQLPAFDPVGATNAKHLWHRGFPLQLLSSRDYSQSEITDFHPDIQADFWNGDPDIDAICRMEHAPECEFDPSYFPMASNKLSPFNTQNTFLSRKVLKDFFLFPEIGRMDDIWAAYHAQARGHRVVFNKPSVRHERNSHDLTKDMKDEFLGYEHNLRIVENIINDRDYLLKLVPARARKAYDLYQKHFSGS